MLIPIAQYFVKIHWQHELKSVLYSAYHVLVALSDYHLSLL